MLFPSTKKTVEKARSLRRALTPPEITLWQYLRSRPGGLRFRRQHPIGPYVLDFYCAAARLAIEVDGIVHDMGDNPHRDARRDAWLAAQGVATLRVAAGDVVMHFEAVTVLILERCALPLPRPTDGPPPHARHGEE